MFYSTQGEKMNIYNIKGINYDCNFKPSKKILTRTKFPKGQTMDYKKYDVSNKNDDDFF